MDIQFSQHLCWRDCLFIIVLSWYSCWKSFDHTHKGVVLFHCSTCILFHCSTSMSVCQYTFKNYCSFVISLNQEIWCLCFYSSQDYFGYSVSFVKPCTKINSKLIKDLNVRIKTMKPLEENIEGKFHDIGGGNELMDITSKQGY